MSDAIHLNNYGQQLNAETPRAFYDDFDDEAQQQRRKERLQRKKEERRHTPEIIEEEPDLDEILNEPKKSKKRKKKRKQGDFADIALEEDVFSESFDGLVEDDLWQNDMDDDVS